MLPPGFEFHSDVDRHGLYVVLVGPCFARSSACRLGDVGGAALQLAAFAWAHFRSLPGIAARATRAC